MTEEVAALDPNMPPEDVVEEVTTPEEAVEVTEEPAPSPVEDSNEPKEDGVQKRINKVTGDKWDAIRRAEEAEKKLAEMQQTTQAQPQVGAEPTLEDFDFDEPAYLRALSRYDAKVEVSRELEADRTRRAEEQAQTSYSTAQTAFNERVAEYTKKAPDYAEVVAGLQLPDGIVSALIEAENGPELAHHLAKHKDVADSMFSMSLTQASMKLGQITAQLSLKPEIKTSAAPEPIEPVSASGSLAKDVSDMSMEEIYNS